MKEKNNKTEYLPVGMTIWNGLLAKLDTMECKSNGEIYNTTGQRYHELSDTKKF
jgi:hypothetical protein